MRGEAAGKPTPLRDVVQETGAGTRSARQKGGEALKDPEADVRRLLTAHDAGDESAAAELIPLVYDRLRALARRYLAAEKPGHLLRPTDLVHEAYLRIASGAEVDWKGKTHFYSVAATQMRRILVEHARASLRQKRGGRPRRITLSENIVRVPALSVDVLALHEALTRLSERHERQGRVAELRIFSGMLIREVAKVLRVSEATVKVDWRVAKAWILKELRLGIPVA